MTIGGTSSAISAKGVRISIRYTIATAKPRRIRRERTFTGPDTAIATKPAMKIHVSGRRSRYISHSVSTTATTTSTTRSTLRAAGNCDVLAAGALTAVTQLSPPAP